MDVTTTASVASTASPMPSHDLVKFCLLWSVLHTKPSPSACKNAIKNHDHHQRMVFTNKDLLATLDGIHKYDNMNSNHHGGIGSPPRIRDDYTLQYRHSSRSLSVIGVLGGIVLILFFVALSTCIKHRRNLYVTDRYPVRTDNFAREILADHIRQLRSAAQRSHHLARDRPPSYEDVVKDPPEDEETAAVDGAEEANEVQPPSYFEATAASEQASMDAIEIVPHTSNNASTAASSSNNCDAENMIPMTTSTPSYSIAEEGEEEEEEGHCANSAESQSHTVTIEIRP